MTGWDGYALLQIDVQRDFYADSVAGPHPDLPQRTAQLLASCRDRGIEVVHVHARLAPDGSDWMARYRVRGRIPCVAATPGVVPLEAARPLDGERLCAPAGSVHDVRRPRPVDRRECTHRGTTSPGHRATRSRAASGGGCSAVAPRTRSHRRDEGRVGWDADLLPL